MGFELRFSGTKVKGDNRPTDFEYSHISEHVYGNISNLVVGAYTTTTSGKWSVITTRRVQCGYFGAIYSCSETKQMVVAHRGTNSIRDVFEDIRGVIFNIPTTPQKEAAFQLCVDAVNILNTAPHFKGHRLSFTGHSLGAFLAELSVCYCHRILGYSDVNAVTFESPGSKESILALEESATNGLSEPVVHETLDIITYVCYPNLINVCNEHIGTVYSINVDLGTWGKLPGIHLLKCHSMTGILEWFQKYVQEKNPLCKRYYMSHWPVGLMERNVYFKYAEFDNGQYTIRRPLRKGLSTKLSHEFEEIPFFEKVLKVKRKHFELKVIGNFKIDEKLSRINALPLQHFSKELQLFLIGFHTRLYRYFNKSPEKSKLLQKWQKLMMPDEISEALMSLSIQKNEFDIEYIKVNIKEFCIVRFRRKLSNWLEKVQLSVCDLFFED